MTLHKVLRSLCLMALVFAASVTSKAQGCISFSNNYAAYVDESADTANIYVDVVVDGSGTMTINRNLPGCGSLPGQATHTPQISIWVTASPSGTLYGATTPGAGQCANCYLSEQTTQAIPIGTDTSWQGSWSAGVICSMAGGIWGTGGMIKIATTNYIFNDMIGPECLYIVYCQNGNTHSSCALQVPNVAVDGPPVNVCKNYLHDHRIVIDGVCFPVGKAELANFPVDCN